MTCAAARSASVKTEYELPMFSVTSGPLSRSASAKLAELSQFKPSESGSGTESMDITLAYLKGKDPESEEAQEHANSSSLGAYA